jgi:hypothetical protein
MYLEKLTIKKALSSYSVRGTAICDWLFSAELDNGIVTANTLENIPILSRTLKWPWLRWDWVDEDIAVSPPGFDGWKPSIGDDLMGSAELFAPFSGWSRIP